MDSVCLTKCFQNLEYWYLYSVWYLMQEELSGNIYEDIDSINRNTPQISVFVIV